MISGKRDQFPSGKGACELYRCRGDVGAILGKLDALHAGRECQKFFSEIQFNRRWSLKRGPAFQLLAHSVKHRLIGMAEADGAEAERTVHIFVAVDIPNQTSLAP